MSQQECMHGQTIKRIVDGVEHYYCPRCASTFAENPLKVVNRDLVAMAAAAGVLVISMPPPPAKFGPTSPRYRRPKRRDPRSILG